VYLRGRKTNDSSGGGFTLIEVLIAVVLVGLAIASLAASNRALTQANGAAADASRAEFLIEEIRELTGGLAVVDPQDGTSVFGPESAEGGVGDYDDLDDFDGAVFSPPISAARTVLSDLAGYSQVVTVENVSAGDFEQVVADHGSLFLRITVRIELGGRELSSAQWLRSRY